MLDVGPAREFLLEKTAADRPPTATDDADARSLAEALDGLALALEQAGAYINEHALLAGGVSGSVAEARGRRPGVVR